MSLPFEHSATIEERDGTDVATCKVTVFKDAELSASVGQQEVYSGFATREAAAAVGKQNLLLTADSVTYRIVEATHHRFLGYVSLVMRRVNPNG